MAGSLSPTRRILFPLGMLVLVVASIELLCWAGWRVVFDEPFSAAVVAEAQRAIAASESVRPTERGPRTTLERMMAADAIHPYLGFVYDPDVWNASDRSLERHGLPVNEFGFVDDKSPIQATGQDRVVVGIFGGSVSMQLGLRGVEALEEQLRRAPRFAGDREFVFVRTALGSHKQPQQSLALDYLLSLGADFDVVINVDGFNEVALAAENRRKGVSLFYPRGWRTRMAGVPATDFLKRVGAKLLAEEARRDWSRSFIGLPFQDVIVALVWKWRDQRLAARIDALAAEVEQLETEPETVPYEASGPRLPAVDEQGLYRTVARIWAESSLQMSRLAAANDIAYFHFLQPNQYVPDSKPLAAEERAGAYRSRHPYRRGVVIGYPHLREAAARLEEEGVEFHDLSPLFEDVADPLYIDTCCHLNDDGVGRLGRRIGEILAAGLAERQAAGPLCGSGESCVGPDSP